VEFQDVVRRRRMVRSYHRDRPVPPDVIDRIVRNGLRAPSAGFSQGWGFLMLDNRVQPAGQTLTRPVTARSAPGRAREHPARPAAPGNLGGWAATSAALLPGASPRAG